jgi:hypothetical protein
MYKRCLRKFHPQKHQWVPSLIGPSLVAKQCKKYRTNKRLKARHVTWLARSEPAARAVSKHKAFIGQVDNATDSRSVTMTFGSLATR